VTRAAALHSFTRSYTIKGHPSEKWIIAKKIKKVYVDDKKQERKLY
jgi:hypothetical protein